MKGQLKFPKYDLSYPSLGENKKKRRPFKKSTKKIEWMRAAGRDPYSPFVKTSYCRNPRCRRKLIWGDRSYEFDHRDNNSSNNSQKNCCLVCNICHARATVIKKRKITGLMGTTIGHQTYKKKVSYKKSRKTKHQKKKHRKSHGTYMTNVWGQRVRVPAIRI